MSGNPADFGVNTYSYTLTHSAWDCMAHLARHGVRRFELMASPGHLWPSELSVRDRQELRRRIDGEGLEIVSLNTPSLGFNLAATASEMRAYSIDLIGALVRLAGDLGAHAMLIAPGKANPLYAPPEALLAERFHAALDLIHPIARETGVELLVENIPICFAPGAERLMALIDDYGQDDIGIVYDVANGWFIGEDPAAGLESVRARLRMVHLSDTGQATWRHDPVGMGTVPFETLPAILANVGHRAPPVLEIISHAADAGVLRSMEALSLLPWATDGLRPR